MLLDFVKEYSRPPKASEIYKDTKLGVFWSSVKQGCNTELYNSILSQNPILRQDYDSIQQLKEKKKGQKFLTPTEKCQLLLDFVDNYSRPPKTREIYKEIKLGVFWSSVKQGWNLELYSSILSRNKLLKKRTKDSKKKKK